MSPGGTRRSSWETSESPVLDTTSPKTELSTRNNIALKGKIMQSMAASLAGGPDMVRLLRDYISFVLFANKHIPSSRAEASYVVANSARNLDLNEYSHFTLVHSHARCGEPSPSNNARAKTLLDQKYNFSNTDQQPQQWAALPPPSPPLQWTLTTSLSNYRTSR